MLPLFSCSDFFDQTIKKYTEVDIKLAQKGKPKKEKTIL